MEEAGLNRVVLTKGGKRVVAVATALVLVCLPLFIWIRTVENADHVVPVLSGLVGQPRSRVLVDLGQPEDSGSQVEYRTQDRADIAASYEPDPPDLEFDEFLVYRWHLRIGVVFIRDGMVVRTYTGLT